MEKINNMEKPSIKKIFIDIWKIKKNAFIIQMFSSIIESVTPFINIILPATIVHELISNKRISNLILIVATGVFLNFLFTALNKYLQALTTTNIDYLSLYEKNKVNEALLQIKYQEFEKKELQAKISQFRDELDCEGGVYVFFLSFFENLFSPILSIVLSIFSMYPLWKSLFLKTGDDFIDSFWLPILLIMMMIIISCISALISDRSNRKIVKIRNEYASINRIFDYYCNVIMNYKVGKDIRLYKLQNFIAREATEKLKKNGVILQNKISNIKSLSSGISTLLFSVVIFGFCLILIVKASNNVFPLSEIVVIIGAFFQLIQAIKSFSLSLGYRKILFSKASLYYEITNFTSEPTSKNSVINTDTFEIRIENVSFSYNNSNDVLKNLDLKIFSGEKIAIVGENGSGKTTFIKLLCRLYDTTTGQILINGKNILEYDLISYRNFISTVFQDFEIFSLKLGEVVASSQNYDTTRVREILNKVGFPKEYKLDAYLYNDCDRNGIEISRGEAQKIAIARALYSNSSLLILDEPTASLDPIAEYELYKTFDKLTEGKTVIYISHRLSSCKFCDKIVVFDNGTIVQCGSHLELISDKNGKYYELWNAQAKYYTEREV